MNLKRLAFLALGTYGLCALWAITGVDSTTVTLQAPSVPQTITLGMLTPEQLQDRAEELTATTTSTTTSTTSSTTSTVPFTRLADFHPDTKCQEWFQTAITVGWPNNTETLEKLGRLLWKETRCLNITPLSSDPELVKWFNGHDHGVAQINQIHTKYVEQVFNMPFAEAMSDPTLNLRFAYLLYSDLEETGRCGWKPWKLC
jgi:hypothetical protein